MTSRRDKDLSLKGKIERIIIKILPLSKKIPSMTLYLPMRGNFFLTFYLFDGIMLKEINNLLYL